MFNTNIMMPTGNAADKKSWQTPTLSEVGHVAGVVRGGGGKLTPTGGDPGEGRKQAPTG